jgi:hypothetical protein
MAREPREYFEDKFDAQLKTFEAELGDLEFKVGDTGWEPETDYLREIEELKLRLEAIRKKFHELKAASDASWRVEKEDIERALDDFGNTLKDAVSRWDAILPD